MATLLVTIMLVLLTCVPVLAAVQYAVWRGDHGPSGCVSRAYLLVTDSGKVDECLRQRMQRLVDERGVVDMLEFMVHETRSNPVLMSRCHLPMHFVAQRAVRDGVPLTRIEQVAGRNLLANICAKGFVHGYLQQLGADPDTSTSELIDTGVAACANRCRRWIAPSASTASGTASRT